MLNNKLKNLFPKLKKDICVKTNTQINQQPLKGTKGNKSNKMRKSWPTFQHCSVNIASKGLYGYHEIVTKSNRARTTLLAAGKF